MNHKRLLKHTKKYLKDFTINFCNGTLCHECKMQRGKCILNDLTNAVCKAVDLAELRRK